MAAHAEAPCGLDGTDRIGGTDVRGSAADRATVSEPSMEVLRWVLFFAIAMFLIVAGIFFVMGRPLPLPRF
jgi:hypothetical protein